MKKIIILISTFSIFANAQDENKIELEDRWFIEGSLGFNSNLEGVFRQYAFSPSVGKFIRSDIAVGLGLHSAFSKHEPDLYERKEIYLGVNPFIKKYWSVSNQFYLFLQFSGAYGYTKSTTKDKISNTEQIYDYSGYGLSLAPGFEYYFTPNWSIKSTIGSANWQANRELDGEVNHSFGFGIASGRNHTLITGNGISFSLKYTFN